MVILSNAYIGSDLSKVKRTSIKHTFNGREKKITYKNHQHKQMGIPKTRTVLKCLLEYRGSFWHGARRWNVIFRIYVYSYTPTR